MLGGRGLVALGLQKGIVSRRVKLTREAEAGVMDEPLVVRRRLRLSVRHGPLCPGHLA